MPLRRAAGRAARRGAEAGYGEAERPQLGGAGEVVRRRTGRDVIRFCELRLQLRRLTPGDVAALLGAAVRHLERYNTTCKPLALRVDDTHGA